MTTHRMLRWSLFALLLGFPLAWEPALSQTSNRQQDAKQTGRNTAMTGNDEQELRKLENNWLSVYISGDKATYDRVVAEKSRPRSSSSSGTKKAKWRKCSPSRMGG